MNLPEMENQTESAAQVRKIFMDNTEGAVCRVSFARQSYVWKIVTLYNGNTDVLSLISSSVQDFGKSVFFFFFLFEFI